jgi:hypothetical protein
MLTKNKRWTLLAKPQKGEHSLWRRDGDPKGVVYIADCSGRNPDHAEDGPLRLVGNLRLHQGGSLGITAWVSVIAEDTSPRGHTMLHPAVALWLVENEGFRAVIGDGNLRIVAKLLGLAT